MPALFDKMGVFFQYPENWTLDEEDAAHGQHSVTVYSPSGGAFWTLSVYAPTEDPRQLAAAALMAMKEVYDNLDAEAVQETRGQRELVGYDINFYCLDLTNSAAVRCLRTNQATYTIFYEAEDREFEHVQIVFEAMLVSFLSNLEDE